MTFYLNNLSSSFAALENMYSETHENYEVPTKKPRICNLIHSAIEAGDIEFVQKIFQYNGVPDINVFDERGLTPLHVAVLFEHQKIVEILLRNGANVDAKSNEPNAGALIDIMKLNENYYISTDERKCYSKLTALYIAVINGSKVIIRMLIENGANVNLQNDHCLSPIHCAVFSECTETVSLLFRNGAKINKISEKELDNNEDITEFVDCLEDHKWLGRALNETIFELKNVEMLDLLIKNGADANYHDGSYSLLQTAITCQNFDMVKILVQNGANLETLCSDEREFHGQTALHFATGPEDFQIAIFLIKHGANVNHQSALTHDEENSLSTPLHLAANKGSKDTAELLMKSGASSHIRNGQNMTPLDVAVAYENSMIRTLLLNGADPENRCTCGTCYPCPLKSYESALEMKDVDSLKIFFNTTHSF